MKNVGPHVDYTLFSSTTEHVTLSYVGTSIAELQIAKLDADTGEIGTKTYRVDPDDLLRAVDTLVVAKKHADQKNGPVGKAPVGPR